MQPRATLKKTEILRLKNNIDELFEEGKSVKVFPLKILYHVPPIDGAMQKTEVMKTQVMFVVSKRSVKKAVHRNQVKRYLREAYRLLKCQFQSTLSRKCPSLHLLRLAVLFQSAPSESVNTEHLKVVLNKVLEKVIAQLSHEPNDKRTAENRNE